MNVYCVFSGERNQKYRELKKREETMNGLYQYILVAKL